MDLHMFDVTEWPDPDDFYYGNTLQFRFKLNDLYTNRTIKDLGNEQMSVMLAHQARPPNQEQWLTDSTSIAIREDSHSLGTEEGYFYVWWTIGANAAAGAGRLVMLVKRLDEHMSEATHRIHHTDPSTSSVVPFSQPVNVGCDLQVEKRHVCKNARETSQSIFAVEIDVKCNERFVTDAILLAVLKRQEPGGINGFEDVVAHKEEASSA